MDDQPGVDVDVPSRYTETVPDALDIVANPRDVDCKIRPGPMFRLVDVSCALEAISYDAETSVILQVSDPLVEWNDGTFELDTNGVVRCDRTDDNSDVSTDINTLSQLIAGYHSVEEAERFGEFAVHENGVSTRLAELFPKQDVFLREHF